jgi:hypothetical protein
MFSNHQSVAFPSRPITHKKFVYVAAALTDIRLTFRKARLLFAIQKAAK